MTVSARKHTKREQFPLATHFSWHFSSWPLLAPFPSIISRMAFFLRVSASCLFVVVILFCVLVIFLPHSSFPHFLGNLTKRKWWEQKSLTSRLTYVVICKTRALNFKSKQSGERRADFCLISVGAMASTNCATATLLYCVGSVFSPLKEFFPLWPLIARRYATQCAYIQMELAERGLGLYWL